MRIDEEAVRKAVAAYRASICNPGELVSVLAGYVWAGASLDELLSILPSDVVNLFREWAKGLPDSVEDMLVIKGPKHTPADQCGHDALRNWAIHTDSRAE